MEQRTITGRFNDMELFNYTWAPMLRETYIPKKVIINKGATIIIWKDDTKTIVKKSPDDEFNAELSFLRAYFLKASGLSRNKANKYIDKILDEYSNSIKDK